MKEGPDELDSYYSDIRDNMSLHIEVQKTFHRDSEYEHAYKLIIFNSIKLIITMLLYIIRHRS